MPGSALYRNKPYILNCLQNLIGARYHGMVGERYYGATDSAKLDAVFSSATSKRRQSAIVATWNTVKKCVDFEIQTPKEFLNKYTFCQNNLAISKVMAAHRQLWKSGKRLRLMFIVWHESNIVGIRLTRGVLGQQWPTNLTTRSVENLVELLGGDEPAPLEGPVAAVQPPMPGIDDDRLAAMMMPGDDDLGLDDLLD